MQRRILSKSNATNPDDNDDDCLATGISILPEKVSNESLGKRNYHVTGKQLSRKNHRSTTTTTFLFNNDVIGQRYTEPSKKAATKPLHGTKINWHKMQKVIEVPILGHFRVYEKRVQRSRPNAWRRHGALVKIYEIGGWITKTERQQINRRERKYFYVKPGSKPCNPPVRPPISIRDSKFLPPSAMMLKCAKNHSIEELSSRAAIHIQEAIQNSTAIFLDNREYDAGSNRTQQDDRNDLNLTNDQQPEQQQQQ